MRALYRASCVALAYLVAPLFVGHLLWQGLRDRDWWRGLGERFGFGAASPPGAIWVHAVSVGEVQAAAPLVQAITERHRGLSCVLTTATPTGAARARALFGAHVQVRYAPYDLPGAVRRFFARVRPRIAIILETEIWPNLYRECGRRRVPLVLASARLSPRSVGRYQRLDRLLGGLFRETLSHAAIVGAQSAEDAARFRSIGAIPERTHVTGNIKFDFALPADIGECGRELRGAYAGRRPVWIAGSTHAAEEEILLDAHAAVRREIPDALLVLVPRHPPRFGDVAELLGRRHVTFARRSSSGSTGSADAEVLLVDTLGELLQFYAAADVAFVGGSLVPVGGHNPLEPAALGLPVLTGPHIFNAEEIARLLRDEGAMRMVHGAADLAPELVALLREPAERQRIGALARAAVERNRGALERLLALIEPLLAQR